MRESTEARARPCAVCSDPVEPEAEHWLHEPGCPVPAMAGAEHVPGAVEVRDALDACDCDLVAHPVCCPDCQEADEPAGVTHAECSDWCPYRGLSGHLPVDDEGERVVTTISLCEVCTQAVHLVDGEWHHKLSGLWAKLPVRHRAAVASGTAEGAGS